MRVGPLVVLLLIFFATYTLNTLNVANNSIWNLELGMALTVIMVFFAAYQLIYITPFRAVLSLVLVFFTTYQVNQLKVGNNCMHDVYLKYI